MREKNEAFKSFEEQLALGAFRVWPRAFSLCKSPEVAGRLKMGRLWWAPHKVADVSYDLNT